MIQHENDIRQWLAESIALEEQGRPVRPVRTDADLPEVAGWHEYLLSRPELAAAFAALTPGRKRGYLLHFASAKQESTHQAHGKMYAPNFGLKGHSRLMGNDSI